MREIKFKAFLKLTKEIVNVERIDFKNNQISFYKNNDDAYLYVCDFKNIELIQFTGLYDKNGKEICENDIVKAKYIEKRDFNGVKYDNKMEFTELVVWKDQAFQLEIDNCGIKMYRHLNFYEDLNNIKLKEIEVIGNIFDNPEPLGEQQ